jgi:hypothetical protein
MQLLHHNVQNKGNRVLLSNNFARTNSNTSAILQYLENKSSILQIKLKKYLLGCNKPPLDFIFVRRATGSNDILGCIIAERQTEHFK